VSMCQNLVGPRMRGSVMAVYYFACNLLGFGLGPQLVGIASDLLHPAVGTESLRLAMSVFVIFFLLAAYCMYRAARTMQIDLDRAAKAL
jgi:MFS family permease